MRTLYPLDFYSSSRQDGGGGSRAKPQACGDGVYRRQHTTYVLLQERERSQYANRELAS